jgi:hypothetical protein
VSLERYGHLIWHLAEAQAILGHERLTRDYWKSPQMPLHERIDVLWRLEVLRDRRTDDATWRDLAREADRALEHPEFQTTWMHHWFGVGFARAGEWDKARRQVERLRRLPEGRAGGHWSTLGVGLLEGELKLIEGDLAAALDLMASAVKQIHTLGGGSREQKDIFRDVFMQLHRRLGHVDEVITLAQERLLANPNHAASLAAMVWAYEKRGDAALQRQACRQLVRRAEEIGVAGDAEEVVAARRTLQAPI